MAPIDLNLLRAFVAVHESGSFSGASELLGVPRSTVSRAVAALETAFDVILFHRTTRKVSTSTAGVALYDRVLPSLTALESSLAELPEREEAPSGVLRVTSTVDLGAALLAPAVARFTRRYPGVQVDVVLSNSVIDLVRHGFDLALRVSGRALRDSSLVARKVGSLSFQLYAAPSYLARRGVPTTTEELATHDWVGFRGQPPFAGLNAKLQREVSVHTRVIGDDMFFAREVLRAGAGLGALPSFLADADLPAGLLVRVMPRLVANTGSVYLVHPGRKHLPRKLTAFRELLLEMLRQQPLSGLPPAVAKD